MAGDSAECDKRQRSAARPERLNPVDDSDLLESAYPARRRKSISANRLVYLRLPRPGAKVLRNDAE